MIPSILPTYNRAPMAFVKGEGTWLIEDDGTRYLDLCAGIAVNALGHAHPALVAAVTEQAGKLWHVSNLYQIPGQQELADRLTGATFADTTMYQFAVVVNNGRRSAPGFAAGVPGPGVGVGGSGRADATTGSP